MWEGALAFLQYLTKGIWIRVETPNNEQTSPGEPGERDFNLLESRTGLGTEAYIYGSTKHCTWCMVERIGREDGVWSQ